MRVIPVIDLKGGIVVRGVAGRRAEYLAIESCLVAGSDPAQIAAAFVRLGLRRVYVADLDAIGAATARTDPNWDCYRALLDTSAELWVDAGLRDENAAERLARFEHRGRAIDGVILGLETLRDRDMLARCVKIVGRERLVFSLDLKAGKLLADGPVWQAMTPFECGVAALDAGVARMIVLDLAAVGVGEGVPTVELCRALRTRSAALELVSGGGVRGILDLLSLADAGCDGALVASALHDGRITTADIAGVEASRR
ncbi:MAG: hisA/hisF family protein [Planctomycetota bacterium]|nr:MAG: hisA/hisF family protein [Planctomycetota bacterium]